ncbi:MAG: M1 family metallopeptidase [Acidobacteriota bacterium]
MFTGCSEAPEPPRLAEPTSALRPETQRGLVPEDARVTDYELEARLDEALHQVTGSARVTWRNRTQRSVDTLPFHLYMNGFRAEDAAWMQTSRGNHRRSKQEEDGAWGYIDIHAVRLQAAPWLEAAPRLKAAPRLEAATQRDGSEPEAPRASVDLPWREDADPSTMTVDLPQTVGPGDVITVQLDFTVQLPRVIARTGYYEDFHAVAQWYPKLGVLEEEAGWQAHTFTVHDEFYADFGNYHVTLDVASNMVVGATGIRTAEELVPAEQTEATDGLQEGGSQEDGTEADATGDRKRLTYVAEMVHDFVWMADPDFVEHHGEWQGVRIRQLIQPEHVGDADMFLAVTQAGFESYHNRFGPYPWSTLTIVHPPEGAEGAGGMEYPTFFTAGDRAGLPEWLRASVLDEQMTGKFVTLHEFGHQYFQGLFASREHLEPWLDEGINTTSNMLAIMDREQSDDPWLVRLLSQKLHYSDMMRLGIASRAFLQPQSDPGHAFRSIHRNYGSTVYMRVAATMLTLRNIVGHDAFDAAMRVYSERARFRHPRGSDFEDALISSLGERVELAAGDGQVVTFDVRDYLDQALRTTRQIDFEVFSIIRRPLGGEAGWHRDAEGQLTGGELPAYLDKELEELEDDAIESLVSVRRTGSFIVPVEIRFELEDGSQETRIWDGRETIGVLSFPGQRVRRVVLDPDNKLLLEWDRLDNVAFAPQVDEPDGLSRPVGDITEALSLALMGIGL